MSLAGWIIDLTGVVLIGTIALMVYAFSVRFLALATQPLYGNLRQQSTALDASARMLGASPWRAFTRINLPLLRPALAAAALLVAIDVIKELPLTLILRPFEHDTLSTKVYETGSHRTIARGIGTGLVDRGVRVGAGVPVGSGVGAEAVSRLLHDRTSMNRPVRGLPIDLRWARLAARYLAPLMRLNLAIPAWLFPQCWTLAFNGTVRFPPEWRPIDTRTSCTDSTLHTVALTVVYLLTRSVVPCIRRPMYVLLLRRT